MRADRWLAGAFMVVAALLIAAAASGMSEARPAGGGAGAADAQAVVRQLVENRLGVEPNFERLDCSAGDGDRHVCRIAFFVGDVSWSGKVTVRDAGASSGRRYDFRLVRSKDLCAEGARDSCQVRVRWSARSA